MKASTVWWCIAWLLLLAAPVGFMFRRIDAIFAMALLLGGHQAMHAAESKERAEDEAERKRKANQS